MDRFNLLMQWEKWGDHEDTVDVERALQRSGTDEVYRVEYGSGEELNLDALKQLPTLLMYEKQCASGKQARLVRLTSIRKARGSYRLEYVDEPQVARIDAMELLKVAPKLGLSNLNFTHWAVKQGNIYEILLKAGVNRQLAGQKTWPLVPGQVAVMMPYRSEFAGVEKAIGQAAKLAGGEAKLAKQMWDDESFMVDIERLIKESPVVVCDVSGRNANVCFELGYARALGKDIVVLAQQGQDVPSDLDGMRHLKYLQNEQGLAKMTTELAGRLKKLL